jgi:hypothetical protein
MLRLTVAFIVVTLTGLPVLPAMCHDWCGEDKATTEYCHVEAVGSRSPAVTAAGALCRALFIDDPFLREDARPVPHTVHHLHAARTSAPALVLRV